MVPAHYEWMLAQVVCLMVPYNDEWRPAEVVCVMVPVNNEETSTGCMRHGTGS